MRPLSLALAWSLAAACAAAPPSRVGLRQVLAMAATSSPRAAAAEARARAARAQGRAEAAARLPDLRVTSAWFGTNREFPAIFNVPSVYHQVEGQVRLDADLAGVRKARVRTRQAQSQAAEARARVAGEDSARRAGRAYLDWLEARASAGVLRDSIASRRTRLEEVGARVDAGTLLETARMQAQLDLAEEERQLSEVGARERLARRTLALLIGLAPDAELAPDGTLDPLEGADAEALTDPVRAGASPQLEALDAEVRAARHALAESRAAALPTVKLRGDRKNIRRGLGFQSQDDTWWEYGGDVEWTGFDGGRRRAEVDIARAAREAARQARLDQGEQLDLQLFQARQATREASARLLSATKQSQRARRQEEIEAARLGAGVTTASALLDAQVAVRSAGLEEVRARFDLLRGLLDALALTGDLVAEAEQGE